MTETEPTRFDVYLWGPAVYRVVDSLRGRADFHRLFEVSAGSEGAVVSVSLEQPEGVLSALFAALERHRLEGGIQLGSEVGRDESLADLERDCLFARRRMGKTYELGRPAPTLDLSLPDSGDDSWVADGVSVIDLLKD